MSGSMAKPSPIFRRCSMSLGAISPTMRPISACVAVSRAIQPSLDGQVKPSAYQFVCVVPYNVDLENSVVENKKKKRGCD